MPVNSVKNRSKSQHHKNSESKSLHFMREVNEEFEKMIEDDQGGADPDYLKTAFDELLLAAKEDNNFLKTD
jgi:hypothetical protein